MKLIYIFLSILLIGCTSKPVEKKESFFDNVKNVYFQNYSKEATIVVIQDSVKGNMWGIIENDKFRFLINKPETAFFQLYDFQISPDKKYIIVSSVGEGHPMLELFETEKILAEGETGDQEVMVPAKYSINPYPLSANFEKWVENGAIISSEVDISKLSEERTSESDISKPLTNYFWDFNTGKVSVVKTALTN